jgi:hypothetical protein
MNGLICQCGCKLKVNCKDEKVFVLCLDCGHYEVGLQENNEKVVISQLKE